MLNLINQGSGDISRKLENTDDIRTKLLDSMIFRLEEKSEDVQKETWEVSQYRAYCQWLLVAAMLIIFCVLRYGVQTVHLHPLEKEGGARDQIIEYKDRQMEKTSEAFRGRHN